MKKKQDTLLLGAHMSIAGGLEKSVERAESIDCNCMQIFTKSNRQWHAKDLKKEEIELFKQAVSSSTIEVVVAHASYLINIGSPNTAVNKRSTNALALELQRCQKLEIPYLVIHPGAYLTSSPEKCLEKISENINTVLAQNPGKTSILLENTAGQGTTVCHTFEQLAAVYKNIREKKRIGFCFDTCHAFAAGYDFRTPKAYQEMWKLFDKKIGLNKLKAIHTNDSKRGLGSKIDRHENIGKGAIGLEGFQLLFNDENLFDIPKILETPERELKDYVTNMKIIYKLLSPATRKILNII